MTPPLAVWHLATRKKEREGVFLFVCECICMMYMCYGGEKAMIEGLATAPLLYHCPKSIQSLEAHFLAVIHLN